MKLKTVLTTLLLGAMLAVTGCGSQGQPSAADSGTAIVLKAPTADKTPVKGHYAVINTSMGTVKIRLYGSKAPITVRNFDNLVKAGYYNGLPFHRVIEGFMIQGGDNGKGGPGYTIPDEFAADLHFNKMGYVAMANRGPNTGDAQFFITVAPTPWLDHKHTIFGVVTQGMDVVEKISKVPTDSHNKPKTPVVIESITLAPLEK